MTQRKEYSAKTADKFVLRFPEGMRPEVAKLAEAEASSMNTLIITALKRYLAEAK